MILGFEPSSVGLHLFLDIHIYMPLEGHYVPYGWSVVPMLKKLEIDGDTTTTEWYVGSGVFSLPIYHDGAQPISAIT